MKKLALALLIGLIGGSAYAQPQRTFISARSGDDANACSLTSPCRNLQRGVDAVAAGGEVIPLDSGGYGAFDTFKSVTISAPPGVYVGVTVTDAARGTAVGVYGTIGSHNVVVLRGLSISNLAGTHGVYFDPGGIGILRVDGCTIDGADDGIEINDGGLAIVTESTISRAQWGIIAFGADSSHRCLLMADHVRVSGSGVAGISAYSHSDVAVRNSVMFGGQSGVLTLAEVGTVARLTIEGSVIDGNYIGATTSVGHSGDPNAQIIRFSNSVIAHSSGPAIVAFAGQILSRGDNTVVGNASDETFSGTFAPK